jgi:hypothetical protein
VPAPTLDRRVFGPTGGGGWLASLGPLMRAAVPTSCRSSSLLMLLACACCFHVARGTERPGDMAIAAELQKYTIAVIAVQRDYLSITEVASGEERFNLYWTYNQLVGTWRQVEFLRALLDLSVAATLPADEQGIRAALRDQAQFALWELDQNIAHLGRGTADVNRSEYFRLNEVLRSLLQEVRTTVSRLSVASGP